MPAPQSHRQRTTTHAENRNRYREQKTKNRNRHTERKKTQNIEYNMDKGAASRAPTTEKEIETIDQKTEDNNTTMGDRHQVFYGGLRQRISLPIREIELKFR